MYTTKVNLIFNPKFRARRKCHGGSNQKSEFRERSNGGRDPPRSIASSIPRQWKSSPTFPSPTPRTPTRLSNPRRRHSRNGAGFPAKPGSISLPVQAASGTACRQDFAADHQRKRKDATRSKSGTAARHRECGSRLRHPDLDARLNLEDVPNGIDEIMVRQPLGVTAAITPFNFPAMIPLWFLHTPSRAATHLSPSLRTECR